MPGQLENSEYFPIAAYFIFPLVGLDWRVFGTDLVEVIVDTGHRFVHIKVTDSYGNPRERAPNITFVQRYLCYRFYAAQVPINFREDLGYIMNGKYSCISEEAKRKIEADSQLPYNMPFRHYEITHIMLLGLRNSPLVQGIFTPKNGEILEHDKRGLSYYSKSHENFLLQLARHQQFDVTD